MGNIWKSNLAQVLNNCFMVGVVMCFSSFFLVLLLVLLLLLLYQLVPIIILVWFYILWIKEVKKAVLLDITPKLHFQIISLSAFCLTCYTILNTSWSFFFWLTIVDSSDSHLPCHINSSQYWWCYSILGNPSNSPNPHVLDLLLPDGLVHQCT